MGDDDRSGAIEVFFDAAGSFSDTESTLLQVEKVGDSPTLYFDTNPDKGYGYEVHREGAP
ncbi:hypothetical protein [Streptomyces sp. NPDC001508]|uniref:hypothetical protein n=1 Tax=Streptomyces sp. NPDC001508 TaxID=3154656 RepID=UPI0033291D44